MSTLDDRTGSAGDPRDDPDWELVRAAARTTVPTPPGLVARVLRSVSGLCARDPAEPLDVPLAGGRLRTSERVVALVARRLRAELGRELGGIQLEAVALETDGVQVLVTVRCGMAAETAAALLKSRLHSALTEHLGFPAPSVHVHIVDVRPD